jgi:sulfate permease, SulP family
MLASLREQLAERNVDLYLVHVRWPVRTVLRHHGLRAELGEDHIWHSISQGVRQARRQHQIPSGGSQEPSFTTTQEDEEMVVAPTYEELADDEPLDGRGLRDG